MCDYSLKVSLRSRAAKVGDHLEVRAFGAWRRGFAKVGTTKSVTCLKVGTEIVFDKPPFFVGVLTWVECDNGERIQVTDRASCCEARLERAPRPLGMVQSGDVIAFADGKMIAVQCLQVGVCATVIQLPVKRKRAKLRVKAKARMELDRDRRRYLYALQRRKRKQEAKKAAEFA
jgi:hypothetical protein